MDHTFIKAYGNDATAPVTQAQPVSRAYPTPAERNAGVLRTGRYIRIDQGRRDATPEARQDSETRSAEDAVSLSQRVLISGSSITSAPSSQLEPAQLRGYTTDAPGPVQPTLDVPSAPAAATQPADRSLHVAPVAQLERAAQLERELAIEREMRLARELRLERELLHQREQRLQQEVSEAIRVQQGINREPAGAVEPRSTDQPLPHAAPRSKQVPTVKPPHFRIPSAATAASTQPLGRPQFASEPRAVQQLAIDPLEAQQLDPPQQLDSLPSEPSLPAAAADRALTAGLNGSTAPKRFETSNHLDERQPTRSNSHPQPALAASDTTAYFAADFYYPQEPLLTGGVASLDSTSIVIGPQVSIWPVEPVHVAVPGTSQPESDTEPDASVLSSKKLRQTSTAVAPQLGADRSPSTKGLPTQRDPLQERTTSNRAPSGQTRLNVTQPAVSQPAIPLQDSQRPSQSPADPENPTPRDQTGDLTTPHNPSSSTTGSTSPLPAVEERDDQPLLRVTTRHPISNEKQEALSSASASPASSNHTPTEAQGVPVAAPSALQSASSRKAAAWEVDRFSWSDTVHKLYETEAAYFRHAGKKLKDASREGLTRLAIVASESGEGCTTLAVCLARAAAAAGARVALMDANFRRPELAELFGLDFAHSWHEALDGHLPLSEASVVSLADELTLIPLTFDPQKTALSWDDARLVRLLSEARRTFDLILIDLGTPFGGQTEESSADQPAGFDAAIVVRDVRRVSEKQTLETVARLKNRGVDAVGIAENFRVPTVTRAAA